MILCLIRCVLFGSTFTILGENMKLSALLILLTVATVPSLAHADASVLISAQGGPGAAPETQVRGPTVATLTAQDRGAVSTGFADLSAGVLKSSAQAIFIPGFLYASAAYTGFFDSVVFTSGFGQTAYLDYSFDGSLTFAGNLVPQSTYGQMTVFAGGQSVVARLFESDLCSFACGAGSASVSKRGSMAFNISQNPLQLGASLDAYAQAGNMANFSNTGKLFLRLPDGVSFTSGSGVFLSQATSILPVAAIPEPSSYALMAFGLGLVAFQRARKHRQP